ncbi:hypothetical protein E8Q33_01970 [Methylophaga sp. SB9B]|uniref:hypothetical protein n=1 Tax=Methylophaga sp. SB9B TaxID=2570356 RepID=UPI00113AE4EC|nr:hypothetical protein [Methylophaga sp. SB9B]THK43392.1 hypothetical protein E8Q33_01970 [Methylophaga sp. SB9B]
MTTYRLLLVITAVCSALITALIIYPVNSNSLNVPMQNQAPPVWLQMDNSTVTQRHNIEEPLTMAIRICTANNCEYIALSPAEAQNLLTTENDFASQNDQYQITVPLQLPQYGVPIIEM